MQTLYITMAFAVLGVIGAQNFEQVCYKDIGCFNNSYPFDHFDGLPESPDEMGLKILFFTRKNQQSADVVRHVDASTFSNVHFDASLPVKVVIHGYLSSSERPWMNEIKDALLEKENVNVLLVDWSGGAGYNYFQSAPNTRVVAATVKRLLDFMVAQGVSWDAIHLIGHSLGAQAAAMVGHSLGSKVGRISGLDPARPYFEDRDLSIRLDKGDAKFVDAIHTNMKHFRLYTGFGTDNPSGHVDYYPNGGNEQPGCTPSLKLGCAHKRAHDLYVDSIKYQCPFVAFPCQSYEQFENGNCIECGPGGCGLMGYDADKAKGQGSFYLDTKSERPFCGYTYVVKIIPSSKAQDTEGELLISVEGPGYSTSQVSVTQQDVHLSSSPISHVVLFDRNVDDATTIKIEFDKSGLCFFRPEDYSLSKIRLTNPATFKTFSTCQVALQLAHKTVESLQVDRGQCLWRIFSNTRG